MSLALTTQVSCGLWEISINSSKDYTRSGDGCKLEADLWGFWDLLFTLMSSMQDGRKIRIGKYWGRRFSRGVTKLGTLGHFHTCLEDPEENVGNSSTVDVSGIGGLCWTRDKSFRFQFLMGINLMGS